MSAPSQAASGTLAAQAQGAPTGRPAALLLFFLTPVVAELLSGSSPPVEFFNPLVTIVQCLAYGGLAVLLREFAIEHRLGWWGRLPLALTVGVFIEGALCKSFFSPQWVDFAFPEGYGRLWGVNWSWALGLTVYHGLMSFLLPWLAVELVYPGLRCSPALSRSMRLGLWTGVIGSGLLGYLSFPMTPGGKDIYYPGLLATVFSWGVLLWGPALAALTGPRLDELARRQQPLGLPALLSSRLTGWALGLGWFSFFFSQYVSVDRVSQKLPAVVAIFLQGLVVALALCLAWQLRGVFSERHRHAVVLGTAWFWATLAVQQELDNTQRQDNTSGMSAIGLAALLASYWLSRLLKMRESSSLEGCNDQKVHRGQIVDKHSDDSLLVV